MKKTIYEYRNQRGTTELSLGLTPDGIVLYCFSVFDTDTGETDTYSSRPFSVSGFRNALENLLSEKQCELVEAGQRLQIRKDVSGGYTIAFDGGGYSDRFEIQGLPFDIEAAKTGIVE